MKRRIRSDAVVAAAGRPVHGTQPTEVHPIASSGWCGKSAAAAMFLQRRDDRSARQLLAAPLIYLPGLLLLLIMGRIYGISS